MLPGQLDLFAGTTAPSTSMVGLVVRLPRECRCGSAEFRIGSSRSIHHAALLCGRCGNHMGWLPGESFSFINGIIDQFGRPKSPIIIRGAR
jgi:hypothetical protein